MTDKRLGPRTAQQRFLQQRKKAGRNRTRSAFAVAATLMRFMQQRLELESIRDSYHAASFREAIEWAETEMDHPSQADMDRWIAMARKEPPSR